MTITMSDWKGCGGAQKRSEEDGLSSEQVKKIRLSSEATENGVIALKPNESCASSLWDAGSGSLCNYVHVNDTVDTRTGGDRLDRAHSIHVLADPFINHIVTCMQEDMDAAIARADELERKCQALLDVSNGSEPLQLLERCEQLEDENKRLEKEVSEGRVPELEGEIQLLRHYIMDLEAKYEELQGQHTQLEEQNQQNETELLAMTVRLKSTPSGHNTLVSRPQTNANLPQTPMIHTENMVTISDSVVKTEPGLSADSTHHPSPHTSHTTQPPHTAQAQATQPDTSIQSRENSTPTPEVSLLKSEPASMESITQVIADSETRGKSSTGGGETDENLRRLSDLDRQSHDIRNGDANDILLRYRDEVALLQKQLALEKNERERIGDLLLKERQKADTYEQEIKRVMGERDSLKRKLLQALTDKQAMRKQGDEVQEELKEQKRKAGEEKVRADSLAQQMREERETWARERERLESKWEKKHMETERILSDVKDAMERALSERDALQNTLQAIKNKNEGLLTTAEKQLAELEGELTNMRAINGQQSEEIRKLRYSLETLEKEADRLAGALKSSRETGVRAENAAKDLLAVKRRLQVAMEDVDRLQGMVQIAEQEREKIRRELVRTLDEKDEILHQIRKDREIHKQQIAQYVRDIELVMADRDRMARALRL